MAIATGVTSQPEIRVMVKDTDHTVVATRLVSRDDRDAEEE